MIGRSGDRETDAGGAYVTTPFVVMCAPLKGRQGADMPKDGTSASPAIDVVISCWSHIHSFTGRFQLTRSPDISISRIAVH